MSRARKRRRAKRLAEMASDILSGERERRAQELRNKMLAAYIGELFKKRTSDMLESIAKTFGEIWSEEKANEENKLHGLGTFFGIDPGAKADSRTGWSIFPSSIVDPAAGRRAPGEQGNAQDQVRGA